MLIADRLLYPTSPTLEAEGTVCAYYVLVLRRINPMLPNLIQGDGRLASLSSYATATTTS